MICARLLIRRVAAATLTAGLLAAAMAGCASSATSRPAHSSGSTVPATAWAKTLSRIGPDGKVDTATALAAFSLAVGPVPGAQALPGEAQTIPSGTLAVQWVLGHWGQLTAGQQHAVLTDLGVTTTAALDRAPAPRPEIPCLTADTGAAAAYRAQLPGIESAIVARMGDGPFSPEVHLSVNNVQTAGAKTGMYTYGCNGAQQATGTVTGCTIHINPIVSGGAYPASDVQDFLTHEMLHCYLLLRLGAAYYSMPSWYVEGVPSWGMTVLGHGNGTESSFWLEYLNTPATSVFVRSYDAIGFFAHLAETGSNVWHKIVPAGQAIIGGGSTAGWRAFAPGTAFLDSWGPGYAQGRYPGQAWRTGGPNLPSYQGPIDQAQVGNGQTLTVRSVAAGTAIRHLDLDAQVVLVTSTGSGRFSLDDGSDVTLVQAAGAAYSTGSPGTACPAGTSGAATTLTPISSGSHYIAVTGGLSAGEVTVQGLSLATFCARQPARPCLVGTWTSTDFQAATSALTERGGAGVVMRITSAGSMSVDFGPMKPVALSGHFGGDMIFNGQISGQIVMPGGARPGVAYSWHQAPGTTADYRSLTATVHITSPLDYTFGPVSVADLAAKFGASGGGVDDHPLSTGNWTCGGDTLVVRAPNGVPSDGTWTWTRTG
jgi:hypothetical protein